MKKDEASGMLVAWIIVALVIGAALVFGSSGSSPDPKCVSVGSC